MKVCEWVCESITNEILRQNTYFLYPICWNWLKLPNCIIIVLKCVKVCECVCESVWNFFCVRLYPKYAFPTLKWTKGSRFGKFCLWVLNLAQKTTVWASKHCWVGYGKDKHSFVWIIITTDNARNMLGIFNVEGFLATYISGPCVNHIIQLAINVSNYGW